MEEDEMKWEYLVLPIADSEIVNQVRLMQHLSDSTAVHYPTINELGQEGWELVTIFNGVAYFKRAMPINTDQGGSAKFSYETCENGYVIYDENNKAIPPYRLMKMLIGLL